MDSDDTDSDVLEDAESELKAEMEDIKEHLKVRLSYLFNYS